MKSIYLSAAAIATVVLSACQASTVDQKEIDALKTDVEALKLEVFGDPLATCPDDKHLADISAYAASLEGLPGADLEPNEWHKLNGERAEVQTTPSGLQYVVVQEGTDGAPSPVGGEVVRVHYHGFFPNGDKFDSSYDRGEPSEFPANRVIRGWVEALTDMKPCEARTLYIPGDLAYGEQGRPGIPPNASLLFHVQMLGIVQ